MSVIRIQVVWHRLSVYNITERSGVEDEEKWSKYRALWDTKRKVNTFGETVSKLDPLTPVG